MTGQAGNRFWVGVFPGYPPRLAQLLAGGEGQLISGAGEGGKPKGWCCESAPRPSWTGPSSLGANLSDWLGGRCLQGCWRLVTLRDLISRPSCVPALQWLPRGCCSPSHTPQEGWHRLALSEPRQAGAALSPFMLYPEHAGDKMAFGCHSGAWHGSASVAVASETAGLVQEPGTLSHWSHPSPASGCAWNLARETPLGELAVRVTPPVMGRQDPPQQGLEAWGLRASKDSGERLCLFMLQHRAIGNWRQGRRISAAVGSPQTHQPGLHVAGGQSWGPEAQSGLALLLLVRETPNSPGWVSTGWVPSWVLQEEPCPLRGPGISWGCTKPLGRPPQALPPCRSCPPSASQHCLPFTCGPAASPAVPAWPTHLYKCTSGQTDPNPARSEWPHFFGVQQD